MIRFIDEYEGIQSSSKIDRNDLKYPLSKCHLSRIFQLFSQNIRFCLYVYFNQVSSYFKKSNINV